MFSKSLVMLLLNSANFKNAVSTSDCIAVNTWDQIAYTYVIMARDNLNYDFLDMCIVKVM